MKLIFPNEGLSNSVNENIHSCKYNLQNALNNCHFSVPSGFAYTNYVNSLYSEINSCIKEINDIFIYHLFLFLLKQSLFLSHNY